MGANCRSRSVGLKSVRGDVFADLDHDVEVAIDDVGGSSVLVVRKQLGLGLFAVAHVQTRLDHVGQRRQFGLGHCLEPLEVRHMGQRQVTNDRGRQLHERHRQ
jgi:hypothetical protein